MGFLSHPAMLVWLLAAAAPLLIHLLSKRKHREVQWAAMQYLLAAMRKNSRRIRIEQWILLAIRTLLIVLLVVALAEPVLNATGLLPAGGQRAHKLLVIDNSYSMGYRPTDKSRFDRAKELAAQIVDESSQGDGFTLVLMEDPPRVVVGSPAFEPNDFLDEIEHLRLRHGGADLSATLEKVETVLETARRDEPRLTRHEVYFLTDLGRNTWQPELAAAASGRFLERTQNLARQAALTVIDLGQSDSENLAVTGFRVVDPFVTVARDATFEAEVRNFGRQPRSRQQLELYVDNRRVGEQMVDLPPAGRASVTFRYRFTAAREHAVEVRLAADLLDVDNHRWTALTVKPALRVLCVNGKPSGAGQQGATDYLASALQLQNGPLVETEVVAESSLVERDLSQYDAVFLVNVRQFTANEAGILRGYLRGGGGLVTFLGDQVLPESYNQQLFKPDASGLRVLPAQIGMLNAEPSYALNALDYKHPLLAPFRGQERAGLTNVAVYQHFVLELPENSTAKTALAFDSGEPLIVEEAIGRGRSVLVGTSADVSWTTLPLKPSFVPIVQELLALAVRDQSREHNVQVGDALGGLLPARAVGTNIQVSGPVGEPSVVRAAAAEGQSTWGFTDTDQSGLYTAKLAAPIGRTELYAVNTNTRESDLARLDATELAEDVWNGVPFTHSTHWQNLNTVSPGVSVAQSFVHRWLLLLVLLLLLTETVVAVWFGRRAA